MPSPARVSPPGSAYSKVPSLSSHSRSHASPGTRAAGRLSSHTSPSRSAKSSDIISNGQWSIDLNECSRIAEDSLGGNYESVYIIERKPRAGSYWKPAVCVPLAELDETMPKPTENDQIVVRRFDDYSFQVVSIDDVVLIQPNSEPYQTFRAAIPRFCQVKEMRLALDFMRYFKLPQYLRWEKFGLSKDHCGSQDLSSAMTSVESLAILDDDSSAESTVEEEPQLAEDENTPSSSPLPSDLQTEDTSDLNHESLDSFTAAEEVEHLKSTDEDGRQEFYSRLTQYFEVLIRGSAGDIDGGSMEEELKSLVEECGLLPVISGSLAKVDLYDLYQWTETNPSGIDNDYQWSAYLMHAGLPEESRLVSGLDGLYKKYLGGFKNYNSEKSDAAVPMECLVEIAIPKRSIDRPVSSQQSSATDLLSLSTSNDATPVASSFSLALDRPRRQRASTFAYGEKDNTGVNSSQDMAQYDGSRAGPFGRRRASVSSMDRPSRSARNRFPVKLPNLSEFTAISQPAADGSQEEEDSDLELSKINLDNYEIFREKVKRLELRLARKSLELWHEFGSAMDYCIDDGPVDFSDPNSFSKLTGKRGRSMSVGNRGAHNCDERGRTRRSNVQRRASFSGMSNNSKRMRYRSSRDSLDDDEFYESDDSSVSSLSDVDDEMDNQRFCPLLEAPEVTLEKEQELELFLLSFGAALVDDGRFPSDNPRFAILNELRPSVDVQEQQMSALRQRYKELLISLRNINSEIRDLKKRKKRLIADGILPAPADRGGAESNNKATADSAMVLDGIAANGPTDSTTATRMGLAAALPVASADDETSMNNKEQSTPSANGLFFVPSLPSIPESIKGSPEQFAVFLPPAQHSLGSLSTIKSSESVDSSCASKQRNDLLPPLMSFSVNTSVASLTESRSKSVMARSPGSIAIEIPMSASNNGSRVSASLMDLGDKEQ